MFTCVYIGLALLVLTMSERDNNDHNQKNQCVKENSPMNLFKTMKEHMMHVNILTSKISYLRLFLT